MVVVARRGGGELPLKLDRRVNVPLLLAKGGELAQQVGIARAFGQQPLELEARRTQVAGRGVSLCDAQGGLASLVRFPAFTLEAFEQSVELIIFQVELGDALDDGELAVEFRRLV